MVSVDDEGLGDYHVAPALTGPQPFTAREAMGSKHKEYVALIRKQMIEQHPEWAKEHGLI